MTVAARALIGAVRAYQLVLAPVFGGHCRYSPSCSVYAMQALANHGAVRGTRLATWRVLRCSPLCAGGHDPVPPRICTEANPEAV